jgi:hypothetical protein
MLDLSSIDWDSIDWCWCSFIRLVVVCWSVFVDRTFVVVVDTSLGFSVGGEVFVFSSENFVGLLNWLWCFIVMGMSAGFSVSCKVFVFSSEDFMGLFNWLWCVKN